MRLLLDENLSPKLVTLLGELGHDAVHLRNLGLSEAPDHEVLAFARTDDRVVVSSDTDFGELLAQSNATGPSVVILRRQRGRRADTIATLLDTNLTGVSADLDSGAIVVLDDSRVRVRSLPIHPDE